MLFISCTSKDKYDPSVYYNLQEQDAILTSITNFIFDAPPYTAMKDRFKPAHRAFYSTKTRFFSIEKLFKTNDGRVYFYVTRPAPHPKDNRGVGGYFRLTQDFTFSEFRELFVTPILPAEEVKGRCSFLFEEMINGNLKKYEKMSTYIQWPNDASYYDTSTYEWKLKPGF
jgi:hypothetical protein